MFKNVVHSLELGETFNVKVYIYKNENKLTNTYYRQILVRGLEKRIRTVSDNVTHWGS